MRTRTAVPVLALALVVSACTGRNVAEIPDADTPTPDETPIMEPVTPAPANEVDRPNDGFPPDEGADDEPDGDGQP